MHHLGAFKQELANSTGVLDFYISTEVILINHLSVA